MYRILADKLIEQTDKVVVLLGATQVGKTTLLKRLFPDSVLINLEKSNYIEIFNSRDLKKIKEAVAAESGLPVKVLILDEIQRLDDPGLVAKLLHDEVPEWRLIISGSSALEIAQKASESLAGRKRSLRLYPLTLKEELVQQGRWELRESDPRLINFNPIS